MASIKKIYLYAVSLVALVLIMYAAIALLNMGLNAAVFRKANFQPQFPQCIAKPSGTASGQASEPESAVPGCDPAVVAAQRKFNEESAAAGRERDASRSIAMLVVALPVFWYHWRLARREA